MSAPAGASRWASAPRTSSRCRRRDRRSRPASRSSRNSPPSWPWPWHSSASTGPPGSHGLSDARAHDTAGMQASRAAGALVAAAGVLCLAGRWGRERPLWLPAALTWIGSGAFVVFDALTVLVNRLVYLFASPPPEADWAPIDTVLVVKVLVGILVGVVGALAISPGLRAAGAGRRTPAARRSRRSPRAAGSGRGRPR